MKISVDRLKRAKEEGFEQIAEHQNGKFYQVSNIDVAIARGGNLIMAKYLLYNGTHSHDIDWSKTIKLDDIRNEAWFNSFLKKHKKDRLAILIDNQVFKMKKTLIIDKPEYKAYATNIDSAEDVEIHITNKTNKVLLLEYEDKEEAEENLITQTYELDPFETLTIYSIYVGINDIQALANDGYVIKGGDL